MEESLACEWNATQFLIISENVGSLIYYSHLLPLAASLLMGFFVLFATRRTIVHWVVFCITLFFSTWVYFDLILWASPSPEYVMFFWSSIVPFEMLIYASCLYLVYLFANDQRDISLARKIAIVLPFIPIIAFTHTGYNVLGLSPDCDEGAIEGPLIQYMYVIEVIYILWAAIIAAHGYFTIRDEERKKQLRTISLGVVIFLLSFTAGNLTLIFSVGPLYEQYKLFGMPIFVAFLTYCAIRFRTFNVKILLAQALVIAVALLVFSILFIRTVENVRIVTAATFVLVIALGYILVRNVRREIEQRELIEKQEKELENANHQQESLLHFISHEIKGYLTSGQNAFAGIIEGDYGTPSPQIRTLSQDALSKMRQGVETVMGILEASNLKKGTVMYKHIAFDLKKAVQDSVEAMRPVAASRGLTLELTVDSTKEYNLVGDRDKLMQHVLRNLIDNAIRYTQKGSIHVTLTRGDAIRFSVKDTGVGITAEDMTHLFTEGGHGKDSIKINVDSTGYGLFIAKEVTQVHGGKIWAESAGEGKGSEFIVELPVK